MRFQLRHGGTRFDVVGFGEISVDDVLLVDEVPPWGGKARVLRRERLGGGQVATAMVALARLGCTTAILGVVGDEPVGREALAELDAEGVDVSGVDLHPTPGATHQSVIVVDRRGERTVLWSEEETAELEPGELPEARIAAGKIFHTDGNHLEAAANAAFIARKNGCVVSCDLDRFEPPYTGELLSRVDLCIVSAGFMAAFAAAHDHAAIAAALPGLAACLPAHSVACVTLGDRGALAWDRGRLITAPAFPPWERIVDTTACGDTFRAGFLCALLDGRDLAACLRFANAAAALKTSALGRRGCPTRARVETFLRGPR